ncbi:Rv3235 family protein [Microlunatus soli]|uniref:Uncharacterized protein n=1 Tax=Microlunatus soli TaxID=630515 RepID=A0A1H1MX60_9ACTN|nr:Rv3235 family protein [Microlunatus soli]SDR91237.1 hypothetical protein SAMN04489812_0293 [Microlunatus soli]
MPIPAKDDAERVHGRSAAIAFRRAPRAGPVASGWPTGTDDRLTVRIGQHQPPLPWGEDEVAVGTRPGQPPGPDSGQHPAPRSTAPADGPTRSSFGAVRILRFGASWPTPTGQRSGLTPPPPDPAGWSIRLADALLEAVAGLRPIGQLDRWLAPTAMAQLARRVRRRTVGDRAALRAVHLQRNTASRTEVVVVFDWPDRTAALAFRLDAFGGRWLCTTLELAALRRPKHLGKRADVSRRAASRSSPA